METEATQQQHSALNILKELSDIKSNLAVNSSETANIKVSVLEIKGDIKEIKGDFVSRRELNEGLDSIRGEISPLKKFMYTIISVMGLAVLGAVMNMVLNK